MTEQRKEKKITQKALAELTGINRAMICRLESETYTPSILQLEKLGEILDFEPIDMFTEEKDASIYETHKPLNIAVL